MQTIESRTQNKSSWGPGPWQSEPDKKQWPDPVTGLPCLIKRNRSGCLCGYVGLSQGHPLYAKEYSVEEASNLECHGGLTYSDFCEGKDDPEHGICHVADDGNPVWWLGFDCSHCFDFAPARPDRSEEGEYRDVPYVTRECESLAKQLIGMSK